MIRNGRARHGLAAALVASGKLDAAINVYRPLVADAPELVVEFAQVLLARNLRLPAAQQDWTEVEKILNDLPLKGGAKPWMYNCFGHDCWWCAVNGTKPVASLVQRAGDPQQVDPWLNLVRLAEKQGQRQSILPLLDDAERHAGKRVEWHLARAEYWLKADPAEARLQLPRLEADAEKFTDADRQRLLAGLSDAYAAVGDRAAAERLLGQLAEQQPNNLHVRLLLL